MCVCVRIYCTVHVHMQAFILVCLLAWFSKTQTCHRLMTHLFQSAEIAGLTDSPAVGSPLQLPLPPPVTTPIHGKEQYQLNLCLRISYWHCKNWHVQVLLT